MLVISSNKEYAVVEYFFDYGGDHGYMLISAKLLIDRAGLGPEKILHKYYEEGKDRGRSEHL